MLGPGFGGAGGNRPPTPAMKRYAVTISRQKRVSLPAGYATSGSICRAFLQQHAPQKSGATVVSEQLSSPDMSTGVNPKRRARTLKPRAKRASKAAKVATDRPHSPAKRTRKPKAAAAPAPGVQSTPSQKLASENTPLRIPYGNKDVAQKLGACYAVGGWYAPPGVDLAAFRAQGWL